MLHDPATGRVPDDIRNRELNFARTLPKKRAALMKGNGEAALTWESRGPRNVGGRTRALGIDRTNPLVMHAGGVSGGMWRSVNGGGSWSKVGPGNELQSVTCVVQDRRPGRSATWFYGTGELRGNSAAGGGGSLYRGDGIYRSINNGLSWTQIPSTSTNNVLFDQPFDYVWNLALSQADTVQTILVAATIGGIQRSTDGGQSWTRALGADVSTSNGPRYTDVVVNLGGVFYATCSSRDMNLGLTATDAGIWRSTDGITWTNITPNGFPSDFSRVVAAIAPSNENVVYFVGETVDEPQGSFPTGHGIWKYTYLGGNGAGVNGTWFDRSVNLPSESGLTGNAVFGTQQSYDLVAAVHPTNENMLIVGAINLYRSPDAFATSGNWTRIGGYASAGTYNRYPDNHPDHHALVFHPNLPNVLYNGNDGGVFRTDNVLNSAVSWTPLNDGYLTTQFYTVAIDPVTSGHTFVMGGMQDNGTWYATTTNDLNPWLEIAGGDGAFCAIEPGAVNSYISLQNGVVYRLTPTTNGRVDPTGGSGYLFVNPFILDPSDPKKMYLAGGSTLWRNNNLSGIAMGSSNTTSTNWKQLTQTGLTGGSITAIGASYRQPNVVYYGTSNGRIHRLSNAHLDNATVTDIWSGKGLPSAGYIGAIAVHPHDENRVLMAVANYSVPSIFWTTNGGTTWTDVSGNLEERRNGTGNGPSVRWVAILPDTTAPFFFAGTSTGLYSTRLLADTSTVWEQEGPNEIGSHVVTMVQARGSDGLVAVGTHGGGTFSAQASVVAPPVPPIVVLPKNFALSRNYPNPFNAGTTFQITVPQATHVRVRIVDLRGRVIATPFDQFVAAAEYPVSWDGRGMGGQPAASGIYFYVLDAPGTMMAGKLTLIR